MNDEATSGRVLWNATLFFLVAHSYFALAEILAAWGLSVPGGSIPLRVMMVMLFSVCFASYAVGWRLAASFLAISVVVSWSFEEVGVITGAVYGPYHYSDMLGPKLGHVPLLIPLTWFAMGYPSHVIANLIADGEPVTASGRLGRLVWVALLGAIVMTGWDLPMDPIMSGAGNWIWEQGGPYYGVPLRNFVGWLLTTFTIYLIYGLWQRTRGARPAGPITRRMALMPVVAYGMFAALYVDHANPAALRVIAFWSMGTPILLAAAQALAPRTAVTPQR